MINSLHQVAQATGLVLIATTCVVAYATFLVVALEYLLLIFLDVLVIGVPMAITVGVITELLTFVPNIGGITALFIAILLAIPQGFEMLVWVVGLYAALQLIESNVITLLLQHRLEGCANRIVANIA